jgi:phosphate transport system substrate-binding protein
VAKKSTAKLLLASALISLTIGGTAAAQSGRDYVYVVGSSTVYPFSTVVAERFGRGSEFKTPKVESTGSGGGLKLFCDGVGVDYPDVTNSSRAIKQSEVDTCAVNGITDIVEVRIGYDGIVLANALGAPAVSLTRADLFRALAKAVPGDAEGELIENPYRTWADVNAALPATRIEVLGPPPTSGTRDAFVELAMEGGGFSFLDQNGEKVKGAEIDGVEPTFDAIADGSYPVSRPLYFYVKKAHVDVIPGLRGFLREFTSERAWGEEGYLSDRGLIPMSEDERSKVAADVRELKPLTLASE